ncbi:N-acetylmuramoyl-L-alanine amidase family protein [Psychrobacillus vulpis]|uniref:N-acetylmuramoyl-L-alanine amidase n=1 Tax=Psychrobacillus vulpis TaxID=2325572 RepID=A0A544TWH9_9BACI|nr:N-acetylmuramoyl-L-alanine amidase [Psychrobacillus vulpis]TQR21781.1 N-acetylmuramoyl-L-alanine amidase family protein [Psychrobacillus vulpis]
MATLNYEVKHIKKHPTTRTGRKLLRVSAEVLHYTANNGGTADNHFTYFNTTLPNANDKLPVEKKRFASAHIFVDRHKALELIPLDEVAFHANERKEGPLIPSLVATAPFYKGGNANLISIGIEMCMEKDGSIHQDTIERTILVVQMLEKKFGKQPIYRHFDVTGKNCPAPFVKDKSLWIEFLNDVNKDLAGVTNIEKIMWGKTELKLGQKGKITVLKDINVWEDSPHASGEIIHTRTLKKGGEFRVYNYRPEHGGQYYLGAGEWVTNMPEHIKYETPSKAMLEKLNNQ